MNPLALQPSPAARRAQSAKRESWKWNNSVTGQGNVRKACLSPLPATWLCPTVSFCCLASGLLVLSPAKRRIVRLRSTEEGSVLWKSMFNWRRFSASCLYSYSLSCHFQEISFRIVYPCQCWKTGVSSGITEQLPSPTYYFYSNLRFFLIIIRLTNPNPPWDIQRLKWVRGQYLYNWNYF